ncbi:MAG TPA: ABC transporter permease [Vicinamibacterales bacterium]|nr:ABC transporter permease [Vicinamibacterales bacterium]
MARLRRLWLRLTHALRPSRGDADVAREVASHLTLLEDEYRRRGMSPEDAHTEARKVLGGVEQVRLAHRDARGFRWLDELRVDVRYALRGLRRHRRATIVSILILAAAGVVNTLVLGVADGVLFRPLPYRDASRVRVILMRNVKSGQHATLVRSDLLALLRERTDEFSGVGAIDSGERITITTASGTQSLVTAATTPSYFEVLGIQPYRGRLFSDADIAPGHVALLSYSAWQQYFGGDETVVGRVVTLGNASLSVVGILPPNLFLPMVFNQKPEVFTAAALPPPAANSGAFYPVVRLARGVTVERAQARLDAIAIAGLPAADTQRALPALDPLESVLFRAGRPIMQLLAAGALAFMVLACVNLASVFLVRSHGRARDVGLRLALGASRLRVVRPVLVEVLVVTLSGTCLALLIARLAFPSLLKQVPSIAYGNAPIGIDLRVVLLTIGLGLITALLFTFVPAWRATLRDAQSLIRTGASHGSAPSWRLGRPLVALQVALTLLLVFGAMLTGRAFVTLLQTPLGFDPQNVVLIGVRRPADPNLLDGYLQVLEAILHQPDVIAAGGAGQLPFDGSGADEGVRVSVGQTRVGIRHVVPGLFETIRVPVLQGRTLTLDDLHADRDAAVLSASGARALFGDANPLGRIFDNGRGRTFHVVGVVSDIRQGVADPLGAEAFAIPGAAVKRIQLVVRMRARNDSALERLRRAINGAIPGANATATWWSDSISNVTDFRNPRFQTMVLAILGGVALLLTAFGIVGVIGFLVVSRTRELAIRTAIGATPESLTRMVVRQGLVPVVAGLIAGLIATHWAGRLAEAQLFKVDTKDATTIALTAIVVIVTTVIAAYVPSRRAARVNPVDVLRTE